MKHLLLSCLILLVVIANGKTKAPSQGNDTTFHYYRNGSVSVKKHPIKDHIQVIQLFSLGGNMMYSFEQVFKSYRVTILLKFREDGSVKVAETSTNSGGSLYHLRSFVSFSNTNDPLWKKVEKYPQDIDNPSLIYYWHKISGTWKLQEASKKCGPVNNCK